MKKTKIETADYTWNPVTGCARGCDYCYARGIARRFADKNNITYVDGVKPAHLQNVAYPYGFKPTLHPAHLNDPQMVKKPSTIFVTSMGDLFAEWIPDEWIVKVLKAAEQAPQHTYMFLTKNPEKYRYYPERPNWWFGTTVNHAEDMKAASRAFELYSARSQNRWLSIEPLFERFDDDAITNLKHFEWVVIGAETGNRKGKVTPEREWVQEIADECKIHGIPVFMKNSLADIMWREFVQEFPEWRKAK